MRLFSLESHWGIFKGFFHSRNPSSTISGNCAFLIWQGRKKSLLLQRFYSGRVWIQKKIRYPTDIGIVEKNGSAEKWRRRQFQKAGASEGCLMLGCKSLQRWSRHEKLHFFQQSLVQSIIFYGLSSKSLCFIFAVICKTRGRWTCNLFGKSIYL